MSIRLLAALAAVLSCADPLGPESTTHPTSIALAPSTAPVRFSATLPGDTILVAIHSTGCFHDLKADLQFISDAGGDLSFVALYHSWHAIKSPHSRRTPARAISSAEAAGIDQHLNAMRSHEPQGVCTSTVKFAITLIRNGRALSHNRVEALDCFDFKLPDIDGKPAMTLDALLWEHVIYPDVEAPPQTVQSGSGGGRGVGSALPLP